MKPPGGESGSNARKSDLLPSPSGVNVTPENRTDTLEILKEKIRTRSAVVGVLGLGYVGLPLALVFEEAGFPVIGFDVDPAKPDALEKGESYIRHLGAEKVARAFRRGRISATTDFGRLSECDALVICVPTPLGKHLESDLSFVRDTADAIAAHLRHGHLVVLESTTYPGTTREELLPRFEVRGLRCGADFFLAFSPEREDPGNASYHTRNIPKVVGGVDAASRDAAVALYGAAVERVVPVSSAEVAESAKLLENIFRSVNIALVNELKVAFDRMGIDVWEVIEAAKTKPFGFMPFYPGPGLGGHCIPLDPFYLAWKAAEYGVWTRFIELAGEINTSMPRYVVDKTVEALNGSGKSARGARILILGLSYKPDIDDDRESPSFEIIRLLRERGAEVQYCDPYVPAARQVRKHDLKLTSVPCTREEFAVYDALVVSTAHRQFADQTLYADVKLVVDTRNVVQASALRNGTVVKA
jgi:UDP-N-acetyl-D-glucosamine dehydrogenase